MNGKVETLVTKIKTTWLINSNIMLVKVSRETFQIKNENFFRKKNIERITILKDLTINITIF